MECTASPAGAPNQHALPRQAGRAATGSESCEHAAAHGPRELAAQLPERLVVPNLQRIIGERGAQRGDELHEPSFVGPEPRNSTLAVPDTFGQRLHCAGPGGAPLLELGESTLLFVAQCGDGRGFFGDRRLLHFEPGDDVGDCANLLPVGTLDDRVIGEQAIDAAQRLQVEKSGDRVAPGEPVRGAHCASELVPALVELGACLRMGAPGGVEAPVRRRQTFVDAGNLAPDAGRQRLASRQCPRVGVVRVVCLGELAGDRFEARPHLLEVALDPVVGLSQDAGAADEKRHRNPDAYQSGEQSCTPRADWMVDHIVIVVRRSVRCQTPMDGAGLA